MSLQEHGEKILQELGLAYSQARLYVGLARFGGCATANELSTFSNVARQDVYRLLSELQRICLVEKVVENPTRFKALPTKEVISILLKKRSEKTRGLLKASKELISEFSEKDSLISIQGNDQFILVPKGDAVYHRIEKGIRAAQKEIIVITPWREFTQWIFTFHDSWRQALERGVKVRWITERVSRDSNTNMDAITGFLVNPGFRLKTLLQPPKKRIGIYDDKEALIATVKNQNGSESPALWTNNPMLIYILEDFFEMKWKVAEEYEKPEHSSGSEEKPLLQS